MLDKFKNNKPKIKWKVGCIEYNFAPKLQKDNLYKLQKLSFGVMSTCVCIHIKARTGLNSG